ncbi:uncharacterized protein A1O9_00002 [Exophiala aquamarina CBS 119918]|uniref:Zn(2)-C6 fungal-type domain-containing protein n=1 Tax=Exophiala aquamarina CBS 119918 TaxID=1182545 RepID=A0A072Q2A8_9EURO|nr:uncharacterized protein A1O9_00002 [Exophiala aquamarina CBS 119918]KEF62030.1 hypothetical protein A1O9_00002 [Exophiala aquamarina CBS 119918]
MPRAFRVRFSKKSQSVDPTVHKDAASDPGAVRAHRKSRHGCEECRRKRTKCDETLPSCSRCQQRNIKCIITTRPSRWREECPGGRPVRLKLPPTSALPIDAKLLQWWLDYGCELLVLDSQSNPLSFPLIEHLAISKALCFALESFSAGHKGHWSLSSRVQFLEKRSLALALCRSELIARHVPLETTFFTVLLLGISTPFMENVDNYGKEHLIGARAILAILLQQDKVNHSPRIEQLLTYYTWWDMACAFSIDPLELPPLSTVEVLSTVSRATQRAKPRFAGCMVEMYHVLGLLLRYCMQLLRGGVRDPEHEATLERVLTGWHPNSDRDEDMLFAEVFQKHGLIILYRVCRMGCFTLVENPDGLWALLVHNYATEIISMVLPHKMGTAFWNSLIPPLLTAGAELTSDDEALRNRVRGAFSSVCSQCQTNTLERAKNLLEEIWLLRDSGIELSYLELMLLKGWNFSLV